MEKEMRVGGGGRSIRLGRLRHNLHSLRRPRLCCNIPGTAKRGTIEGPGFNRFDVGIFRNFRIVERLNFQFRAEAFNAPNHTNVQTIGTSATSSTFGQVTGYRDARILQFAGKFTF